MPTIGTARPRPWDRRVLTGAAVVVLGVIALTAWTIWDARRVRWTHAIQTSENLASALGHDIQRNIEILDLSLRAVIEGLRLPELANVSPQIRNHVLFDGSASAQDLGTIFVLDENGDVVFDSHAPQPRKLNFADRDYFMVQRDRHDAGLYVSQPHKGRFSDEWGIALSRRIEHPDGSFAGVVAGSLRLSYFKRLFDGVDQGANGTVALFRGDGRLIMRTPYDPAYLGEDYSRRKLFQNVTQSSAGHFEVTAVLDGINRLFVYQRLGDLPLILTVGAGTDTILAEWLQKAIFTGIATLGLLALLALLATVLRHEVRRAARADAFLKEAIESISEGFVIYDKDDRLVLCNEAYRRLYPKNAPFMVPGARFEEIVRAGLEAGQTPEAIGHEDEWLAERMRQHGQLAAPHEHHLWDGRWVLTSERRMPSGGIAGLRIDITALKAIQASLRASRAELIRAQRVSRTGSVVRNLRTKTTEWSDETYRIFGVTRGDFVPTTENFLNLVHPEDRDRLAASIAASEKGAKTTPLQYRIIRPDGEMRWVYREAEIIYDDDGTPASRVSTYKDVTEQQTTKLRQEELETQLRHSQKLEALGTLAGGIAHDLNNTLVPILALSKMGMKRAPADSAERRDLEVIARASEQARDLVKQILAFSRKQAVERQLVDVAVVVSEAMQMLRASLPSTIRIVERLEEVPAIFADANQLHQVVTNLMTNAAQAIGENHGTITVTVEPWGDRNSAAGGAAYGARLTVVDTGCGMDEAVLGRVFEPFFTTKDVGQGSGLGLAVVHGIVTSHGGRIECHSRPGAGTEFTIYLPVSIGGISSAMESAA